MTWTAAVMSDDNLDPDSLVGRMLRCDDVSPVEREITGDGSGESLPSFSNEPRVGAPSPLWRVMWDAFEASPPAPPDGPCDWTERHGAAAEIEALRDWLLPELPEPPSAPHMGNFVHNALWNQRHHLRARLTEQARIARGEP